MFTVRSKEHIHMCCVNNRNTNGCDRVRISRLDKTIGYVLLEDTDKIPARYLNSPFVLEVERVEDVPEVIQTSSYDVILRWAIEAQEMLGIGYTDGVRTNISMIIAQAKEEIEARNE